MGFVCLGTETEQEPYCLVLAFFFFFFSFPDQIPIEILQTIANKED